MGWFGHSPWDGDSPQDMLATLDEQRAACLARLVGVPIRYGFGSGKHAATLKKVADDWARRWHIGGRFELTKKGPLILKDRFDQWSVVGVICKVLNEGVGLDRKVVTWAFDAAEAIWADDAWCNTWRQPAAFRSAVRLVADQLAAALDKKPWKLAPMFVWATIEPAPEPKRPKRRPIGQRRGR
jgi:hypothetical protein